MSRFNRQGCTIGLVVVALCLGVGCDRLGTGSRLEEVAALAEREAENKTTVRRLLQEMDRGNFDIWDEVTTPDYIYHFPSTSEPLTREDHKETNRAFYAAFPDMRHVVEDIVADGDKVVVRLTNRGTHQGAFMGIEPTGKEIAMSAISMLQLEEGKIVEEWIEADVVGLLQQLGSEVQRQARQ